MSRRKMYINTIVAILMSLLWGNSCFASLLDDELKLDGVSLGSSIQAVTERYGQPTNSKDFYYNNGYFGMYDYEGQYRVCYLKSNGSIWSIETWATNVATSAGISVGMSKQDVISVYGHADYSGQGQNDLESYTYENSSGSKQMKFYFDNNGYIVKISIDMNSL